MFGRWLNGRRAAGSGQGNALAGLEVPRTAGLLSCRVLDPVNEVVPLAEFVVTDSAGRKVFGGETDPFGNVLATVPAGEYRLAVTAEGFTPFHASATVVEGGHASLGDVTLQLSAPPQLPAPGEWEVEPMHSQIGFTARHIGLARIHGRFNNFAGAVRIADRMEDSAMHVIIDAASIDTNVQMRDDHLRSSDFLDVGRYPTMEFYSERFVHRGGTRWGVTGALTLHGVSRTVTLDTQYLGLGNGLEGETRAACRATTELHREDFTLTWQTMLARGIAAVGSSISIDMDIQIVPKT
ncbi:YceI family protein [Streptomyces sp. NBC_00257]|uniref:YceI family protein n=1 Tax=unclassified Streptomyces TaxID=2593676 RepID=UPI00224DAE15|nr:MULTISPECIES: YceI family protein [unclassified Streptomyces]WTB54262.1 YceI family protein [Streptomyces sp. NBC_00826]WTH92849.1 YceI family protein [Streptomyces sp. NBC_00825]WTI01580.1 YceI family protein [Streptomyces sp. NBC_00822]MCX4867177.1 YceI family protein [Streptomyces sp. NBC_00906]MCX4898415.1 YceI family protein [Streptomyces sp. NBC_00892]